MSTTLHRQQVEYTYREETATEHAPAPGSDLDALLAKPRHPRTEGDPPQRARGRFIVCPRCGDPRCPSSRMEYE